MIRLIKKTVTGIIEFILYTILTERQRNFIAARFSEGQKNWIKKLIKGKKAEQRQQLQQIKFHLYNLGFAEKALDDLMDFYKTAKNPNIKRMAAWEIALWYANDYTESGALQALPYLEAAADKEKNKDQLRRIAIVKAECLERINELKNAKSAIDQILLDQKHPDLYLALANLETSLTRRVEWINKALEDYQLRSIKFDTDDREASYDDLKAVPSDETINSDLKVSVILPAFKAADGISTALDSILAQTWQNLEILVVDDCSPDNTAEVVKEYIEKDSRIKLFSTPVNSGPYVARNIALQHATGEFVTINDSDDWSHPQKIETQARHLMENESVIANTSEHARLTEEELKLYRRGTPGRYIFPNMSSIMFRRQPVLDQLGYWDSVRFAADGEFKRRLLKEFGKRSYVDLKSGPLSLPRQSVVSLTGSSAFGYNGFFMGVRREYVESLEYHHARATDLYYSFPMEKRPFPVPEPMWPQREEKDTGHRKFDIVIAADFRKVDLVIAEEIKAATKKSKRIGFVQLSQYDSSLGNDIYSGFRSLIDGQKVQILVYGEKINTAELVVINPAVLEVHQKYVPEVKAEGIRMVVSELPKENEKVRETLANANTQINTYFGKGASWQPTNEEMRRQLSEYQYHAELTLSIEEWAGKTAVNKS